MFERCCLADHATEGHPDDVGRGNSVAVENADHVPDSIVEGISRLTWRIFRRETGIAMVVANDKAAVFSNPAAESLRPP